MTVTGKGCWRFPARSRHGDAGLLRVCPAAWMTCGPRRDSCAIAASTSSACSTLAHRSSSAEVARGIVPSAAPGLSTAAATGMKSAEAAADELATIREPGVFIVDDVAFIQAEHGMAIGEAIARRGNQKAVLPRDPRRRPACATRTSSGSGRPLGLQYMFLGVEAIDEEGLKTYRKRVSLSKNFEALEFARSLGIMVAINIIADPDWDRRAVRGHPPVVPGDPGDRQYQREHAVSGHRELADRIAPADHARLPALRHPARRAADAAAAGRVL